VEALAIHHSPSPQIKFLARLTVLSLAIFNSVPSRHVNITFESMQKKIIAMGWILLISPFPSHK